MARNSWKYCLFILLHFNVLATKANEKYPANGCHHQSLDLHFAYRGSPQSPKRDYYLLLIVLVLQSYRLQQLLNITLPAVDHHRASVRRRRGFHSSYKGQQSSGVIGHPVLRPGCEVELTHLVLGWVSSLSIEMQYTLVLHVKHHTYMACILTTVAYGPFFIQDVLPSVQRHPPPW